MAIVRLLAGLSLVAACGAVKDSKDVDASVDRTVTIARTGTGGGTITSTPAGIDCGADCSEPFPDGTSVSLHVVPDTGSMFVGWSGGPCTGTGDCTFTVNGAAVNITAMFGPVQHTLAIQKTGMGTGTVTSNPAGVDCGTTCLASFNQGASVVLTATATANSAFTGWTGVNGCTGTGPCTVTMDAPTTVTVGFARALVCTTVTNVSACTNGSIAELNLGAITATQCHDQCQVAMAAAGMTTGCWVLAGNGNCYCRSGTLNLSGTQPGGTCT